MTPGAIRSAGRELVEAMGPLPSSGAAERVHDPAEQRLADGDLHDPAGGLDRVALLDRARVTQDYRADRLLLEVEGEAHDAAREFEHLGRQRALQAVDLGDPVTDFDDRPDAARLDARIERIDGGLDDAGDLVGTDGHVCGIS